MKQGKWIAMLVAMIAMGVFALSANKTVNAQEQPGGAVTIAAAGSATVKAVDADKRTVTIETPEGASATIKCGKNVVNFDQIKAGDQIKAVVFERVAVAVGKGGPPGEGAAALVAMAPKGARPGIIIADTAEITAKIESVDAANRMVTLQGPEGKAETIKIAQDVDLSSVKQGDDVQLRVTKGLALWDEKAQDSAQPAAGTIKPGEGAMALEAITGSATVESIDQGKRLVTLKLGDGSTRTIHLGKECINFDQIKVGDQVRATLAEEVAVAITKGGAPPSAGMEQVIARAPEGAKPGVLIAESAELTGKIDSIDAAKRSLTITEADGKPRTIKAGPKVDLSALKAGDDVTVQATQALAIVVEKP